MTKVFMDMFGELSQFAFIGLVLLVAAVLIVAGAYAFRAKKDGQVPTVAGAEQAVKDAANEVKKEL